MYSPLYGYTAKDVDSDLQATIIDLLFWSWNCSRSSSLRLSVEYDSDESKVLRYFGNMRYYSTVQDSFGIVVKVTNHTELRNSEVAWYSPCPRYIARINGSNIFLWRIRINLNPCEPLPHNKMTPYLIWWFNVLWSTVLSTKMFLVASAGLCLSLNSLSISSWIRTRCSFVYTAFKPRTKRIRAQREIASPTAISPTTTGTFQWPEIFRSRDIHTAY